jgi:hypothetical protein
MGIAKYNIEHRKSVHMKNNAEVADECMHACIYIHT